MDFQFVNNNGWAVRWLASLSEEDRRYLLEVRARHRKATEAVLADWEQCFDQEPLQPRSDYTNPIPYPFIPHP